MNGEELFYFVKQPAGHQSSLVYCFQYWGLGTCFSSLVVFLSHYAKHLIVAVSIFPIESAELSLPARSIFILTFKKLVIWEVKARIDVSFQYFVLVSLCLNFYICH